MQNANMTSAAIAQESAAPRKFEADLLLTAASCLSAVAESWGENHDGLDEALLYNRHLWTIFLASVTSTDNPLPTEIRQNVANLGLFVLNQTVAIMSDPRPERLEPLININCELAAGLLGHA
jgi:flagellar protein FlaF